MPRAFRAARPKALLAPLLLLLATSGCVSLELTESARPFPGRRWPSAPTIAVAEARDRRPDPGVLGRVGWNSLKITGNAGSRFRNTLMTSLNEHAYNVRYVGNVNVLDPGAVVSAVREAQADYLLTAAVLDIRAFSVDPFFDPADVDFTAQVNLLDPDGRTRYTRHIHIHEDRRLWFNPAFGVRDMLDDEMDRVAEFVATDSELIRVVSEPRRKPAATMESAPPQATDRPISSTEMPPGAFPPAEAPPPAAPPPDIPLSEIPEAPNAQPSPPPQEMAPLPGEAPPGPGAAVEPAPPSEAGTPSDEASPEPAPAPDVSAPVAEEPPPEAAIAPDEAIVPPPAGRDPVFLDPGASP